METELRKLVNLRNGRNTVELTNETYVPCSFNSAGAKVLEQSKNILGNHEC